MVLNDRKSKVKAAAYLVCGEGPSWLVGGLLLAMSAEREKEETSCFRSLL